MMDPQSNVAEMHDAVVCARCGHPIWDQRLSVTCVECESKETAIACSLFLLNDFSAAPEGFPKDR
jgi:Zn finger protein HypA/HybF involved in hydrogenase expression